MCFIMILLQVADFLKWRHKSYFEHFQTLALLFYNSSGHYFSAYKISKSKSKRLKNESGNKKYAKNHFLQIRWVILMGNFKTSTIESIGFKILQWHHCNEFQLTERLFFFFFFILRLLLFTHFGESPMCEIIFHPIFWHN